MMTKQKIVPILGWEDATKVLDQWMVILDVKLGPQNHHPSSHELNVIV